MKNKLLINFKNYAQGYGSSGKKIANTADNIARETDKEVEIVVSPPTADLRMISNNVNIPVYCQHIDPIDPGSHTGSTLAESIKEAGAEGVLINHSEKEIKLNNLEYILDRANEFGLENIVCVNNLRTAKVVDSLDPDYIAIEPPELIGGDTSVTSSDPEIIEKTVKKTKTPILCGAGVSSSKDVSKALELGSRGVLVASGIIKSKNPEISIKELLKGF
ncbi:MAG: Triosephosphate isomerase TpiA [Candidatus Methanohalarchaeum thermophilum]|uniref:Triosephosphate isomerase n=1 Tax=Methanohalarchaeum thermophilum TaxID=1903181 RepID=A0A1Q6DW01_METT1|nr:MAG: Triosephosphate isomerase TpiA [Candidatus Methanohalarchaeum thermophilum]